MRIGIFGHYGNLNLGDEAIIEATIAGVRRRFRAADVVCFSMNPADSSRRHGVDAVPIRRQAIGRSAGEISPAPARPATPPDSSAPLRSSAPDGLLGRLKLLIKRLPFASTVFGGLRGLGQSLVAAASEARFLAASYRQAKRVDLMVITGSNQFLDNFGGAFGFPYTLLKWTVLCRLARVPVVYLSVGAGPLEGNLSKLFIRTALRFASYVSYRDHASRSLVEGPQSRSTSSVYPDLAWSLEFPKARADQPASVVTVAINPMPVYDGRYWYQADEVRYRAYLEKLGRLVEHLATAGYRVAFFGTQASDYNVIADLRALLPDASPHELFVPRSVQELMEVIQRPHVCVATRFHGTVLPLVAGTPVMGVCYHRKSMDVLVDAGQEEYWLMLDEFDPDDLIRRLQNLLAELPKARARIGEAAAAARDRLDEQFRLVAERFDIDAAAADERQHVSPSVSRR